jgi:hypothetical protein
VTLACAGTRIGRWEIALARPMGGFARKSPNIVIFIAKNSNDFIVIDCHRNCERKNE